MTAEDTNPIPGFAITMPLLLSGSPVIEISVTGDRPYGPEYLPDAARFVTRQIFGGFANFRWGIDDQAVIRGMVSTAPTVIVTHAFGAARHLNHVRTPDMVVGDPSMMMRLAAEVTALKPLVRPGKPTRLSGTDHFACFKKSFEAAMYIVMGSVKYSWPVEIGPPGRAIVATPDFLDLPRSMMAQVAWIIGWLFADWPLLLRLSGGRFLVLAHAGPAGALTVGRVYPQPLLFEPPSTSA